MEIFVKIKYISIMVLKRVLIYLALSAGGWYVLFFGTNNERNTIYGIGNYINASEISGMLALINCIFLILFFIFLLQTKKVIYKSGVKNSEELKEYVIFETILEASITLGYVLITSVISFFISDYCIVAGLIVPVYCAYYITHNIFAAISVTLIVYIALIFVIIVLPYFKLKRDELCKQKY